MDCLLCDKTKLWIFPAKENKHSPAILKSRVFEVLIFALVVLKLFSVFAFLDFPQNIFFADITRTTLVSLVNNDRKLLGIGELVENAKLNKAAMLKAEDMFNSQYFNHQSPSGKTPWHWFNLVGYSYKYAGENLAIGFFESEDVYNAWLESKSHRDILMSPKYKEVGTAVLTRDFQQSKATIIVQLFGYPAQKSSVSQAKTQNNTTPKTETKTKINANKVLSESDTATNENIKLDFFYYQSEKIIQTANYIVLFLMAFVVILSLYFNSQKQNSRPAARFLVMFLIVLLSTLLSREFLASSIPYAVLI